MKTAIVSLISALVLSLVAVTGYAFERGKHGYGGHGDPGSMMMKLVDKLDLSEEQESEIKAIFENRKTEKEQKQRRKVIQELMALDPMSSDYEQKVSAIADEQAEKVREMIVEKAKVRTEIYEVLTPEQREELEEIMAKKMEKIQKKMDAKKAKYKG